MWFVLAYIYVMRTCAYKVFDRSATYRGSGGYAKTTQAATDVALHATETPEMPCLPVEFVTERSPQWEMHVHVTWHAL